MLRDGCGAMGVPWTMSGGEPISIKRIFVHVCRIPVLSPEHCLVKATLSLLLFDCLNGSFYAFLFQNARPYTQYALRFWNKKSKKSLAQPTKTSASRVGNPFPTLIIGTDLFTLFCSKMLGHTSGRPSAFETKNKKSLVQPTKASASRVGVWIAWPY